MIKIGQYGYRIKNIEAATLLEYQWGTRDHYEYKDALFVNSLFNDYLTANGLETKNEESTRDLICLEFNYGTRSYQQELDHLRKIAWNNNKAYKHAKSVKDKFLIDKSKNKKDKINQLIETAYKNKDNYHPMSKEQLRKKIYTEGCDVVYTTHFKDGRLKKSETIHYKMLFRSTNKAKKGTCIFVCDRLYNQAINFLRMGLTLPDTNADIVGISAYMPLVASGIEGRIKINPHNILILKDVDRFFETNVVSIETDENKHCHAIRKENYELMNELFDGQALIDTSIFPSWADGYVLLRHHFTKMAAFHTNMQQFFKDWCLEHGKDYETYTVDDMWGNPHKLCDVELLTTVNAVKWVKYGVSYDYWCEWVEANDCMFGVVKHSHPSKLDPYQKMSYQMCNSLSEEIMESTVRISVDYVNRLKSDEKVFHDYLRRNSNFSNDYEVLLALCDWNADFVKSSYYKERKKRIISSYLSQIKSGEVMQFADNLTIVGSPYAMLLYGASGLESAVDEDTTLLLENGTIQCYTTKFKDDEYLAGFRSPFNGKYNMSYLHNHFDERMQKYFNFAPQIIAVNMIGTDFQDRNNGSDQDSDFMFVTNQEDIVRHAQYCYANYPTIVNNIPKDTNKYNNTLADYAIMDNMLAGSQRDIGESSNLAQVAQSYTCNFSDQKFEDYVAILSVIAQASIDSAKRRVDIDISNEIKIIKEDMDITNNKYPKFWKIIKRGFNSANIDKNLKCPMNYLADLRTKYSVRSETIDIREFFENIKFDENRKTCKRVETLIEKYQLKLGRYNHSNEMNEEYLLLRSDFDELINEIRTIFISRNYQSLMYWLLDRAFLISPHVRSNQGKFVRITAKNRSLLLKVLYEVNPKVFLSCFKTTTTEII